MESIIDYINNNLREQLGLMEEIKKEVGDLEKLIQGSHDQKFLEETASKMEEALIVQSLHDHP